MRSILILTVLAISTFASLAQDLDSISKPTIIFWGDYVPSDCLDSTFHIEKLEEITSQELGVILSQKNLKTSKNRDKIIEGVDFYNAVALLKTNQNTDRIISNEKNNNLIPIYKSDIVVSPKYTIRVEYDFENYQNPDRNTTYFIFDNVNNHYYKSVYSLDILISLINSAKIYMENGASRNQADLDAHLDNKIRQLNKKKTREEYRGTGGGGRIGLIIGGLLGAWLLVAVLSPS